MTRSNPPFRRFQGAALGADLPRHTLGAIWKDFTRDCKNRFAPEIKLRSNCFVQAKFGSTSANALADSGSTFTVIQQDLFKPLLRLKGTVKSVEPSTESAIIASGVRIKFGAVARIHFKLDNLPCTCPFFVTESIPAPVILGQNFFVIPKPCWILELYEDQVTPQVSTRMVPARCCLLFLGRSVLAHYLYLINYTIT